MSAVRIEGVYVEVRLHASWPEIAAPRLIVVDHAPIVLIVEDDVTGLAAEYKLRKRWTHDDQGRSRSSADYVFVGLV